MSAGGHTRPSVVRAQSNVIGVAVLLGVTVVTLGTLTASIGMVVDENAATADASRVAADIDAALDPVATTGVDRGAVSFTSGRLRTVERDLRVLNASGTVDRVPVGGLVFTTGDRRVAYVAGAVVRGRGGAARMYARPSLTASRAGGGGGDAGVLIVGAPMLNATETDVAANGNHRLFLESNVSHRRTALGTDAYRVAIETETPRAWRDYFARRNATVEESQDFDGDGVPSVVATFPGTRTGYLVVHDMRLEVSDG